MSLYCRTDSSYSSILPELKQLLESLKAKWEVEIRVIPGEQLTPDIEQELKMLLRNLSPQKRGEIVTSRGDMLPLSKRGKNLNLANTPILLIERDGLLTNVFPRRKEDLYTDVRNALIQMLDQGVQVQEIQSSPEELAKSRLAADANTIESGLKLVGVEVSVEAGFIDLLLRDATDRFLVVEVKREADDATIGQVHRLSASLAKRESIDPSSIRKMIVCARMNRHMELAADSAKIEIRKSPDFFERRENSDTKLVFSAS